jgi:hypothetical protein
MWNEQRENQLRFEPREPIKPSITNSEWRMVGENFLEGEAPSELITTANSD